MVANHDLSTQALKINVNHTWVTDDVHAVSGQMPQIWSSEF